MFPMLQYKYDIRERFDLLVNSVFLHSVCLRTSRRAERKGLTVTNPSMDPANAPAIKEAAGLADLFPVFRQKLESESQTTVFGSGI
jgi:hypothetical protein